MPGRSLDVHMHAKGVNFNCTECHTTEAHKVAGRCFTIPAYDEREQVIKGKDQKVNYLACFAWFPQNVIPVNSPTKN